MERVVVNSAAEVIVVNSAVERIVHIPVLVLSVGRGAVERVVVNSATV
jgi:hypothetical protein